MPKKINTKVLMSDAQYFGDEFAINAYMDSSVPIDRALAQKEHDSIRDALESIGVEVLQRPSPGDCQDGMYTANWALCTDEMAVMSRLPGPRQNEEPYAEEILRGLGKKIVTVPEGLRYSGQGDSLPCGTNLFTGTAFRTDKEVHKFLADTLGYKVISLQTIPARDQDGKEVINDVTGWPDSFFYDIDLAIAVLSEDLIAWCPEAFDEESRRIMRSIPDIEKIEVSFDEAINGLACNLVSTGDAVVMSNKAPQLEAELRNRNFQIITPNIQELSKGGGYIRCCCLTLNNSTP